MIYLDNSATTKPNAACVQAMTRLLCDTWGNPSSVHELGIAAERELKNARKEVAASLGAEPDRVFFTSGGTEADNWAIFSTCERLKKRGNHIVTTAVEHHAVLHPMKALEAKGFEVTYLQPDEAGFVSADTLKAALRPDTILVSIMMVNNESGAVMPIADMIRITRRLSPLALFHTDAVQGFLEVPFAARTLGADFVTVSAHKIGGPKGIGALYVGPRVRNPRPLLPGGGQEDGLRSGTEATAQIAGFAKAVELRLSGLEETLARMVSLRDYAVEQLSAIPDVQILGGGAPHILALSLAGWPSQNIVNDLGAQGICISAGSACHQGKPSHVVAALKLAKRVSGGVIRLSFGPETTRDDIDQCAAALRRHHDTRMPML